jgi:hypothetical protein
MKVLEAVFLCSLSLSFRNKICLLSLYCVEHFHVHSASCFYWPRECKASMVSPLGPSVLLPGDNTSGGWTAFHLKITVLTRQGTKFSASTSDLTIHSVEWCWSNTGWEERGRVPIVPEWTFSLRSLTLKTPLGTIGHFKFTFHSWQIFWEFCNSMPKDALVTDTWNPVNIWVPWDSETWKIIPSKSNRKQFYLMSNS